jgi:hypothetical protein
MQWAPGVLAVRWANRNDRIGNSPAAVYRRSGVVVLNPSYKGRLTPQEWCFILLHEMGHIVLQTSNEKAVDEWAFAQYASRGHSLKASVNALLKSFSFTNPEQIERANLQYQRALHFQKTTPRPQQIIKL